MLRRQVECKEVQVEAFENNKFVQQGESWTLNLELLANDIENIPFMISSERFDTYATELGEEPVDHRKVSFVCTVASTKYEKNARYVKSWWNMVENQIHKDQIGIPAFNDTTPIMPATIPEFSAAELATMTISTINTRYGLAGQYAEQWDLYGHPVMRHLYTYTLANEAVDPILGHKPYHFGYFVSYQDNDTWQYLFVTDYECVIAFTFDSKYTTDWTGQNYMYQVTLVEGRELEEVLVNALITHGIPEEQWPESTADKYKYVKSNWPDELQKDIDEDSVLGEILSPEVILAPTKLEVFNNLRTII